MTTYITMDTNFLNVSKYNDLSEFRLNSDFYKLLEIQDNVHGKDICKVLLPEIVFKELLQHEFEAYCRIYDGVKKYAEQLGDLIVYNFKYEPETYRENIERKARKYLAAERINVLPICSNDQFGNILEASVKKQPPFEGIKGKADKGFKDAVIWFSLLDYAKERDGKFIFITNDKIFLDNYTKLSSIFERETGSKISFYCDVEEVRHIVLKSFEKIQQVEIDIQEKEWEIYSGDEEIIKTISKQPIVRLFQSDRESQVINYINNCIHRYYDDVKEEWISWRKDLLEGKEHPVFGPYSDEMGFEVLFNKFSILCVRFTRYAYVGGVHGTPLWKVMTFDLNTGTHLNLMDVMNIPEEEIYALAVQCLDKEKVLYNEEGCRTHIDKDFTLQDYRDSNDLKWFIDSSGIHIYFDVCEAAPYSAGFINFLLSDKVYKKQGDRKVLLISNNMT